MADEREAVAARLRRIREAVRERSLDAPSLPEPRDTPSAPALEPVPDAPRPPLPEPPDAAEVNDAWQTSNAPAAGLWARLVRRALEPFIDAQQAWNARQVQLDNRLLEYLNARFDGTHGHYDRVLGLHGKRMQEIDERHLILQEELVRHVHDLVKRTDLVLAEAERGRVALEAALKDLSRRLAVLEEKLPRG
jgi:hypothetical protein